MSSPTISQRRYIWRRAEHLVTAVTLLAMLCLAALLLGGAGLAERGRTTASVPVQPGDPASTPTTTPAPTLTPTPELVAVQYRLTVHSEEWTALFVDVWYGSGEDARTQQRRVRIAVDDPYIIETRAVAGTFVELFAVLTDGRSGELTCSIVVGETVIRESTGRGQGAGAYCVGPATP